MKINELLSNPSMVAKFIGLCKSEASKVWVERVLNNYLIKNPKEYDNIEADIKDIIYALENLIIEKRLNPNNITRISVPQFLDWAQKFNKQKAKNQFSFSKDPNDIEYKWIYARTCIFNIGPFEFRVDFQGSEMINFAWGIANDSTQDKLRHYKKIMQIKGQGFGIFKLVDFAVKKIMLQWVIKNQPQSITVFGFDEKRANWYRNTYCSFAPENYECKPNEMGITWDRKSNATV